MTAREQQWSLAQPIRSSMIVGDAALAVVVVMMVVHTVEKVEAHWPKPSQEQCRGRWHLVILCTSAGIQRCLQRAFLVPKGSLPALGMIETAELLCCKIFTFGGSLCWSVGLAHRKP